MPVDIRLARAALARAQVNLDEAHLRLTPVDQRSAPMITAEVAIERAEDSVRTALRALEKLDP